MTTTDATPDKRAAAFAMLRAEIRLFLREPGLLFWVVGFPTLLMAGLGLIPSFREPSDDLGGRTVIDLYVPISVLLAPIMAGLQGMPPALTSYRERGILRRLRVTPARPSQLLTVQVVIYGVAAALSSLLVIVVGALAYDVALPEQLAGYALAYLLALAGSLALGALLSAIAPTTKAVTALSSCVFFPTMFTAGVWIPVPAMPGLMRDIVEYTPMGAGAAALTDAAAGAMPEAAGLGVIALWSAAFITIAVRYFRWE